MYLTKNGRASQLPCNEIQPTSCIPYHIVQYHTNKKQLVLLFFSSYVLEEHTSQGDGQSLTYSRIKLSRVVRQKPI
jgi:hypothetical protein